MFPQFCIPHKNPHLSTVRLKHRRCFSLTVLKRPVRGPKTPPGGVPPPRGGFLVPLRWLGFLGGDGYPPLPPFWGGGGVGVCFSLTSLKDVFGPKTPKKGSKKSTKKSKNKKYKKYKNNIF